jgi:RNA polymerase sigma-70 factor (ECF subfamily)
VNTPHSESARWFADEVQPHDAHLKAYLRAAFPAVRDVEDVVQESYLRVWRARAVQPVQSAKAFLFTVARRIALDLLRSERRSPFVAVKDVASLFAPDAAPDAGTVAGTAMEIELLVAAVDALPPRCREIFLLCQVEGLSQRDVAARLGLSENTVAVQSARGLQRCEAFVRRRLAHL